MSAWARGRRRLRLLQARRKRVDLHAVDAPHDAQLAAEVQRLEHAGGRDRFVAPPAGRAMPAQRVEVARVRLAVVRDVRENARGEARMLALDPKPKRRAARMQERRGVVAGITP